MNAADRAVIALANAPRQVFTRQQALDAGVSPAGLHRRLASEQWVAWGPHALHVAGAILDYRGQLLAGLLDLGPASVRLGLTSPAYLHHQLLRLGRQFVTVQPRSTE